MTSFQTTPRRGCDVVSRLILLVFGILTILITLDSLRSSSGTIGIVSLARPLVIALLPVGVIVTFRWPVIFPFGLWAALLPFDFLLAVGAGGTVTRYLELLAIGMIALRMIVTRRLLSPPSSWLPWLIVVAWMTTTALWSIGPEKTQVTLNTVIPLFLLLTVVAVYPISVEEMRAVLICTVVGSLGAAAYGFNLYSHGELGGDGRLTLMTDSGLIVDPNFFATSFLLPIAICLSVAFAHRSLWIRLLASGAIFAMVASIFLSGSRGAFISAAFLFAYILVRTRNRLAILAIGAGAGLSLILFPTLLRRFNQDQTNSNGSGRTFIWNVGAKALSDHYHWLTGSGIGTFPIAYDRALSLVFQPSFQGWSRPSHNVLVGMSVELGFVGAGLLLFAWWRSFRQNSKSSRVSGNYMLRLATEGAVLALFVNALFIDPILIKYYWLVFMIPLMLYNLDRKQAIQQARTISGSFTALRLRRFLLTSPRARLFKAPGSDRR